MTDFVVTLPIPDPKLSPNGRSHWRKKHRLTKRHRQRAKVETIALLDPKTGKPQPVAYSYSYYWPRSKRDDDNAIASAKAYLDGICEALGIDDKNLRFRSLSHHSDRKTPRIEITLHLSQPTHPEPW